MCIHPCIDHLFLMSLTQRLKLGESQLKTVSSYLSFAFCQAGLTTADVYPPLPPSLEMNTNIGLMIVVAAMTFSPVVCLGRVGGYFRGGAFSGSFATPHPSEDERSKSCRPDCMKKMVNPIPPRCNGKTNDRCCYEICNPAR